MPKPTNIIQEGPLGTLVEKQSREESLSFLLFKKERESEEKKGDEKRANAIFSRVLMIS